MFGEKGKSNLLSSQYESKVSRSSNNNSDNASISAMRNLAKDCLNGQRIGATIYVAVKLGIPDLLKDGTHKSSYELAKATKTYRPFLYRLLRTLSSIGILAHDPYSDSFSLTALGETLRKDSKDSLWATVLLTLGGEMSAAWNDLEYSLRTGRIAFDHIFGMRDWEYWALNFEQGTIFNTAMSNIVGQFTNSLLERYQFSSFSRIVDVAGGDGSLMITLLRTYPNLQGVVMDLPHVAARARTKISEASLASRCEVIDGNILSQSIPYGGDVYVLSRIIHDWDNEKAIQILTNCNRAMQRGKKVLLIERIMPSKIDKNPLLEQVCMSDLNMMVMNGGLERTAEEFERLLNEAGFRLESIVQLENNMNVIEGIKV
jgi:ubiquinone/menaquinone biosynthesis C-methylase UbiE